MRFATGERSEEETEPIGMQKSAEGSIGTQVRAVAPAGQSAAGRAGPGVGASGASVCALGG
jgi:hypothetical protein